MSCNNMLLQKFLFLPLIGPIYLLGDFDVASGTNCEIFLV